MNEIRVPGLAAVALLAFTSALCAAGGGAVPQERAADCIAKSHDPVACFVGEAAYRFLVCKLNVQLSIVGGAGDISRCSTGGDASISEFYDAALKKFAKNKAGQSMTRDYYAFWKSSMGALVPGSEMTKALWAAQTAKLEAELTQRGERLELEK